MRRVTVREPRLAGLRPEKENHLFFSSQFLMPATISSSIACSTRQAFSSAWERGTPAIFSDRCPWYFFKKICKQTVAGIYFTGFFFACLSKIYCIANSECDKTSR